MVHRRSATYNKRMATSASELRPDLQLVPTERIRFHEHPERRRTLGLMERIQQQGRLRNPPIVAAMPDGDYLLLDGANRVSALAELGYSHIPVQVVNYGDPAVQLKGWHHLLIDSGLLDLRSAYRDLSEVNLRSVDQNQLSPLLELREVFAILAEDDDTFWGLFTKRTQREIEIHERIKVLEAVVAAYEGQSQLERIKLADYSQLSEVVSAVEHRLILFPVLHKEELLHLAAQRIMIPTGLTRHLIPGRALGIDVDLSFLIELRSDNEKVRHFQQYIDELSMRGRIRFYEESVFIMNE